MAGGSSRDLPLQQTVEVKNSGTHVRPLSRLSMIKEFRGNPNCPDAYGQLLKGFGFDISAINPDDPSASGFLTFINDLPVNKLPLFTQGKFSDAMIGGILAQCNGTR